MGTRLFLVGALGIAIVASCAAPSKKHPEPLARVRTRISSLDLTSFGPFFGRAPDGILGYDFLRRYVVLLDYENRAIEIYDPSSYENDGPDSGIVLDTSSRQPYVTAVIATADGRRAEGRFLIDTGSSDGS